MTDFGANISHRVVRPFAALLCGLAVLGSGQPRYASPPPAYTLPVPALAAALPGSGAVARFYERQNNRLIWFDLGPRSPAAGELLAILQTSSVDGVHNSRQLAAYAQQARQLAQRGDQKAMVEADRTLSTAWVSYVQALRRPPAGIVYGTDRVRSETGSDRILSELASAAVTNRLRPHVAEVARVNPVYAALRATAVEQMRKWGVIEAGVRTNLERTRAFPAKGRFVLVDSASARLLMFEDGRAVDSMKVIVGRSDKQTPMMASMIHYTTFNPYWNVPDEMVRERIAPNVLNLGMKYLRDKGYEVVLNWAEDAPVMAPESVDWKAVAAGRAMVRVRQKPGPANSMGDLKFPFPNGDGIYLHDTPLKELFESDQRALSAGCVRLEDAERLARWLLRREPRAPSRRPEAHVQLPQGVPIFLTSLAPRA
jgi:murein L,D-transpeptidase YcbB/YkuD